MSDLKTYFNDPKSGNIYLMRYREISDEEKIEVQDTVKKFSPEKADKILLEKNYIRKRVKKLFDKNGNVISGLKNKEGELIDVWEYFKILSLTKLDKERWKDVNKQKMPKM